MALLTPPSGFIDPAIDGEETSYFEWLGAGAVEIREVGGAMHRVDRKAAILTHVAFGFGAEHLFLRLDAVRPLRDLLEEGWQFAWTFLAPEGPKLVVSDREGQLRAQLTSPASNGSAAPAGRDVVAAAGTILEVAVPLAALGLAAGARVAFFVTVFDGGIDLERHPSHQALETRVPDERFEARNWSV
jgi:hypothetical protein